MSEARGIDETETKEAAPASEAGAPVLIVGLGASAGGLEALGEFFDELPAEPGMAFVVVTHLARGSLSSLPEILARHCRMPVVRVEETVTLEANRVYVPPPGVALGALHGRLHALESPEDGQQMPIDFFFRSLALDQKELAVGIVLSGTGTDGTSGLKEIRAAAGLTMAQDAATARYFGMPGSASVAVELDHVLPPSGMARALMTYAQRSTRPLEVGADADPATNDATNRLFMLLRHRTGHDFSEYKSTTTTRRIARRLHVHQIDTLRDYLKYVQANPQELDALFRDLLIGVTSFFRDPEAFQVLGSLGVSRLFANLEDGAVVRCWVAGCSTGEEAYSIAMLLEEHRSASKQRIGLQVFATDLEPGSVETARSGVYPAAIRADVTPERLARFFTPEDGHYRIKKEIREIVVFAPHDLLSAPPFSKLDLLVCRNLLIYLNADVQKRLVPLFHYSLRPGGLLFLGSSETIGSFGPLFEQLDKKCRLFRRKEVPPGTYVPQVPSGLGIEGPGREAPMINSGKRAEPGLTQLAERAVLQHLVPPTVLMHESGEIVHIQGRTGLYLEPAAGPQVTANVYGMARPGLELELGLAVRQAAGSTAEVVHRGVRVKTNGDFTRVDLRVRQLGSPQALRGLFLVSFEAAREAEPTPGSSADAVESEASSGRVRELEQELERGKELHQSTVEQLETANEELTSANEELQSINEEMQSANEELETSKEEMQSLNEELQTVNAELQGKVDELSRTNDDMKNLLNATDIATIFLDNKLNIKRYTEQAKRVIRLIPSDISRSIADLAWNLHYATFVDDAREVLRTLLPKETEVQRADGAWYLVRILPYRTTENLIDGLVVTFVDVTKVRGLQEQTRRLLAALASSPTAVSAQDLELRYEWSFGSVFGRWPNEIAGRTDSDLLREEDAGAIAALKSGVLEAGRRSRARIRLSDHGPPKLYDLFLEPIADAQGNTVGLTSVITQLDGEEGD